MTSEKIYQALWADLEVLRPAVENFASDFGYNFAPTTSLGRYPRLRLVQQVSARNLWIELSMGLDSTGRRFIHFSPSIPYELGGGTYVDRAHGAETYRYSCHHSMFEGREFQEFSPKVGLILEELHRVITSWSIEYVVSTGESYPLPQIPNNSRGRKEP